jgi:hypothetical protein
MPIINKGIFNINSAYLREVGNDWPTAQVIATSDIIESSSNLYFTNTRVVSALVAGDNISIESNGRISANITAAINDIANISLTIDNLTTDGITEGTVNLYYTNTRVVSALTAGNNITIESNGRISASVQDVTAASLNLTTADVRETSNLYFTNTRSRQAISGGTGVIYDSSTGVVSIGQNVATTASVTFKDVFVSNNLVVYGSTTTWGANNLVVSDNMIYLNNQSNNSNPDLGISFNYYDGVYHHAGFFRDASDGVFKVFDNYEPEPDANIFIDTNHNTFRLANLQATNYIGNVTGFVTGQVSSLANHDTSSLNEGSNLYFTADRVNATVQPFLTTANVVETSGNLYFTNARVVSALIAGQNITIEANGRISSIVSTSELTTADVRETSNLYYTNARVVTTVTPLLTTANVVETSSNLYFSNARAIASFSAGNGIQITQDGIVSATGVVPLYTLQTASVFGNVSSTMSNIITFPSSPSTDRYMVRSIHVVNMSGGTSLVSGNILYSTGNTAPFANQIPVSQGGILEFFKRSSSYQLFQPGDTINLQGFNAAGTATANLMCVTLLYDTFSNDETYIGTGKVLSNVDSTIQVYDSGQSYSVIESIKFVNLNTTYAPVKAWWADANGNPKTFFVYNLTVPPNSTVEILQSIKRIDQYDKIYASYSNAPNAAISVFVSARVGSVTGLYDYTPTASPGGAVEVIFTATDPEGTTFYYTIE